MDKKGKRIEAEFHLPEAIIQHIQSFLNAKEAAQTTLLSKSWYGAWLTRPNLDFDYKDFKRDSVLMDSTMDRFCKFVEKTMERYEKLNLKILSLRLNPYVYGEENDRIYSVASKCIVKALEMGATGLDFAIVDPYWRFALPDEVFGSENLIGLSLSGCNIVLGVDRKFSCWRLKSLSLENVRVESDIIRDIISSCPLIEKLSLSPIILSCPLIEKLSLSHKNYGMRVDRPFNRLKSLLLLSVKVDMLFLDDFSSKFPCLKDLSLDYCSGYNGVQISSPSLECISFTQDRRLRVKFDVPSIRRFTFSGSIIPSLSFETTSSKWESNISITCINSPKAKWFLKLNKLLRKLSPSKVSLSFEISFHERFACPKIVKGLHEPEVENLTISPPDAYCIDLLEGLFQCCRPIYVTQHWPQLHHSHIWNSSFMGYIGKGVMYQVGLNSGLDQVDVEFFDEVVSAWRPRFLDASTSPGPDEERVRLRLHLIWRC